MPFIQASPPLKSVTGFLTTYISQSDSLYWLQRLSVTLQTETLSASYACSQLYHNDCILDQSVGDFYFQPPAYLWWKGSWSLTHRGIVSLYFHLLFLLQQGLSLFSGIFMMNRSISKTLLMSDSSSHLWGDGCGSHRPWVHNGHVCCSHCSSISKLRLQILCPLDCLFAVPSAEHSLGPA